MEKYEKLASELSIKKTIKSLNENGIEVFLTKNSDEAKKQALKLIPRGSEVLTMTSVTLDTSGIGSEINESEKYISIRKKLNSMDRNTQGQKMNKLGAAPKFAIGSVHAVTEEGHILIASKIQEANYLLMFMGLKMSYLSSEQIKSLKTLMRG